MLVITKKTQAHKNAPKSRNFKISQAKPVCWRSPQKWLLLPQLLRMIACLIAFVKRNSPIKSEYFHIDIYSQLVNSIIFSSGEANCQKIFMPKDSTEKRGPPRSAGRCRRRRGCQAGTWRKWIKRDKRRVRYKAQMRLIAKKALAPKDSIGKRVALLERRAPWSGGRKQVETPVISVSKKSKVDKSFRYWHKRQPCPASGS